MVKQKTYIDKRGRELFVGSCSGYATTFGTFWRSKSGGMHRVVSKFMPITTKEEAQSNLDAWAIKNGLVVGDKP